MSDRGRSFVTQRSPYQGATFFVHYFLGDLENEDNGHVLWLSMARLAARLRLHENTVYKAVQQMVDDGFLTRLDDDTSRQRGKPRRYRFEYPQVPVAFSPDRVASPSEKVGGTQSESGSSPSQRVGGTQRESGQTENEPNGVTEQGPEDSHTSSSTSSKPDPSRSDEVKEVVNYWRLALHPRAKWSDKRARKVAARLKEGYSVADLKQAVEGAVANAHVSEKGERYDDLELICRDATKVDLFMSRAVLPEPKLTGTALLKSIAAGADMPTPEAVGVDLEVVGANIDEFLSLNPPAPQADLDGIPDIR